MLPRMNRTVPAAILTCAAAFLATACASSSTHTTPAITSTASCEQALLAELKAAEANPNGPSGTKPPACAGLSDATLNTLAQQALASAWADMATATALPTDLPTPTDFPTDLASWPTDLPS